MDKLVEELFVAIGRGDSIKIEEHLKPMLFGLIKGINPNSSRDDGIWNLRCYPASGGDDIL